MSTRTDDWFKTLERNAKQGSPAEKADAKRALSRWAVNAQRREEEQAAAAAKAQKVIAEQVRIRQKTAARVAGYDKAMGKNA